MRLCALGNDPRRKLLRVLDDARGALVIVLQHLSGAEAVAATLAFAAPVRTDLAQHARVTVADRTFHRYNPSLSYMSRWRSMLRLVQAMMHTPQLGLRCGQANGA